MKLKAVIFDLNGTVLSDEDIYGYAFKRVLLGLGAEVKTDHPHVGGIGMTDNWSKLLREYKVKTKNTTKELAHLTQKEYIYQIDEIELNSGFLEFATDLKNSEISIALATSNIWEVTEKVLEKFSLLNFFDVVTTIEEVEKSKPDPEIFLLTAKKLIVDPFDCLVFEDSASGVLAAKSAGMKVIGIARDRKQKERLKDANKVISGFYKISVKDLEDLN